jgi:hypothetical protein
VETLVGLPAHPLIVHFPLVAIPMAAILVVLFALKPSWRSMLSYLIFAMGAAIAVSVVLAAGSGEALEERVDETALLETHAELGDQLQIIGVIFGVSLIALGFYHILTSRHLVRFSAERSRQALIGFTAIALVTGSVAVVWDVRTGHSGAESVWSEEDGAGERDDEDDDDDGHVLVDSVAYFVAPSARLSAH